MHDIVLMIPVAESIDRGNIRREPQRECARRLFARVTSVGEREFYDAAQAGYDLSMRAEVWTDEYRNERMLEFEGEEYSVIRSYRNDKTRRTELYCERMKGRG